MLTDKQVRGKLVNQGVRSLSDAELLSILLQKGEAGGSALELAERLLEAREVVGQKALAKGYHPIEIRYFDQNGGQLKMKVSGNDGKEIPFTHLYAH